MKEIAGRLRADLASARLALTPKRIAWYPYDTLSNVEHLGRCWATGWVRCWTRRAQWV
jgi:hypothetical protein